MAGDPNKNLVTLLTSAYESELTAIRAQLESEGIKCFLRHGLTNSLNGADSAMGGIVNLQINEYDLPLATEILKENGFDTSEGQSEVETNSKLQRTPEIRFKKRQSRTYRLVAISFFIFLIVILIYFIKKPDTYQLLTENTWCVDNITFSGNIYHPNSMGIKIIGRGFCNESIFFNKNGEINLPGFKSYPIRANWKLENKELKIMQADTFDFLYNGIYMIDFSDQGLTLRSTKTTIYCFCQHF